MIIFFAELKNVVYEDKLRSLHLTTLETGRLNCDLIESFTNHDTQGFSFRFKHSLVLNEAQTGGKSLKY